MRSCEPSSEECQNLLVNNEQMCTGRIYSTSHSRALYTHQLRKACSSTAAPPAPTARQTLVRDVLRSCHTAVLMHGALCVTRMTYQTTCCFPTASPSFTGYSCRLQLCQCTQPQLRRLPSPPCPSFYAEMQEELTLHLELFFAPIHPSGCGLLLFCSSSAPVQLDITQYRHE